MNHSKFTLVCRLMWPLLLTSAGAMTGCLAPPTVAQTKAARKVAVDGTDKAPTVFTASWIDSGGNDGKGGTKVVRSESNKSLPLRKENFPLKSGGDSLTKKHPKWMVYKGTEGHAISYEWTWVTTEQDKFWGSMWCQGGVAFGGDWPNVDATGAKYLVFWVKVSEPMPELEISLGLSSKGSEGEKKTGEISINPFVEGKKLTREWTRVIVPIKAIPAEKIQWTALQTVIFGVKGKFPENKPLYFRVENIYFSDADMVTPVENLGYMAMGDETLVVWDKEPGEKLKEFIVKVDGKEVTRVPADQHKAKIKLAAGAHKIVVNAAGDKEISAPISVDANIGGAPPQAATVTLGQATHEISKWIFGTNFANAEQMKDARLTVQRWGGNAVSKYNWKRDLGSSASDWFFLNGYAKPEGTPEEKKGYYQFIKEALDSGAQVNFTIPMLPWIAKAGGEGERLCGFPASKYPKQEKIGSEGCGNGMMPDGKEKIWDNDPSIGFIPNSVEFQKGLVENIKKFFGGAAGKGVKFYTLDNEPGLWRETHRDVYKKGHSSEEFAKLSYDYAAMIKSVDPAATVIGFASWGAMEMAGSNMDYTPPGEDGYKHYDKYKDEAKERWRDVKAHNGDPNLVTYLKTLRKLDGGKRVVDAIDAHWYQEIYYKGKKLVDDLPFDPDIAEKQFDSLREYWDPTYDMTGSGDLSSWTANDSLKKYLWTPFHPVIPATKKMIEAAYPGTKLCINEFYSGSTGQYHGALIRTVMLGIFAQEDLYMSEIWGQGGKGQFTFWGQKLFGNYDGKGGHFGGKFVKSTSSNKDLYSFVAQDGNKTTIILVNKNQKAPMAVTIKAPKAAKTVQTHTLTQSLGLRYFAGEAKGGQDVVVQIPAFSAQVVVLQ